MIRLGYACISMATKNNPNKKTTLAQLQKLDRAGQMKKLRKILQTNFFNLMEILAYNREHAIYLYRLPSEFVPFATHPVADGWDWEKEFSWDFDKAGEYIRKHGMRVTSHPGHYSILNTPHEEVLRSTINDFDYHARVLDRMGLDIDSVMVTHVGGVYGDKQASLDRFADHFQRLPDHVKKRLVVENDDTSFGMREVLELCERLGVPMILDVHHHDCVNNGERLEEYLPRIFQTWGERTPKIHFSSPRSESDFRSHADNINVDDFLRFVEKISHGNVDIMLECKQKDLALLRLREELKEAGMEVEAPISVSS
ncbi:UV DNA damage repair endonuclease UvsE [Brevibacillus humidisoli]|uniref:UV DNA damage repair endonuclease UvsE n=1 Tax=Brevibacillus humidisoli TaxID=2895522 RepID=UPI001E3B2263|nr:UV DNA damage repair endonuclease UvsE [Brevibacillus humidisoli]UFJ43071.1 UV DNA damage repair endonuclease UvsE [Brevibacillus humidisoli]